MPKLYAAFAVTSIVDAQSSRPEALADYIRREIAKWRDLINRAGIKPE